MVHFYDRPHLPWPYLPRPVSAGTPAQPARILDGSAPASEGKIDSFGHLPGGFLATIHG